MLEARCRVPNLFSRPYAGSTSPTNHRLLISHMTDINPTREHPAVNGVIPLVLLYTIGRMDRAPHDLLW